MHCNWQPDKSRKSGSITVNHKLTENVPVHGMEVWTGNPVNCYIQCACLKDDEILEG